MLFETLASIIEMAKERGRSICAWRPYPTLETFKDHWVRDSSATLREYRSNGLGIDRKHRSQRIIISAKGEVEGL
jgi:hypothetical protein